MKRHDILIVVLILLGGASWFGCDAGKPRDSTPIADTPPVAQEPIVQNSVAEPVEEPERTLVDVGENVSGKADFAQDGDKHIMAPILVPLGQYFTIRERTVFNIQIPQAMNLYKAAHDNKGPATHEEFMKEIIEANQIQLPSLRNADDKYQYDPESGELKISTTKK